MRECKMTFDEVVAVLTEFCDENKLGLVQMNGMGVMTFIIAAGEMGINNAAIVSAHMLLNGVVHHHLEQSQNIQNQNPSNSLN